MRTVAGWILGIAVLVGASVVGRDLVARARPGTVFGGVFVPHGWAYALAGIAAAALALLVGCLLVTAVLNRRRRRARSPWPTYRRGLTHLFLAGVLVLVYYPILHLVAASFDPRNALFSFRPVDSDLVLVRAKVLPDLSQLAWSNYLRLFDGVVVAPYQWALLAVAGFAALAGAALGGRLRAFGSNRRLERLRDLATATFVIGIAAVVVSLTPDQFTGRTTESRFLLWVRNTLVVAGLTGTLSVVLTATAGYAFARFRSLPGRFPMLMAFVFVQMFPGFLTLIAIFYLMSRLGLLNTLTGLVLAYSGAVISFGTWIYKGYLESLGTSLEEAALVDGANRWQAFTRVVVPLSMPIFVFIFLMQFVGAYSEFILANLFLTGIESWTVGIGLYSFTSGQFSTRWGIFAAASIIGSLPILAVFYGFQRAFVSGYTAGGVKG